MGEGSWGPARAVTAGVRAGPAGGPERVLLPFASVSRAPRGRGELGRWGFREAAVQ